MCQMKSRATLLMSSMLLVCCAPEPVEAGPPPAWALVIAEVDPVFAGAPTLERAWRGRRIMPDVHEVADIETALPAALERFGSGAVERVLAAVDAELGERVAAFLQTPAGEQVAFAEGTLMMADVCDAAGFRRAVREVLTDAEQVGPAAKPRFEQLQEQMAAGDWRVSPYHLGVCAAALSMTPKRAPAARAFYRSPVGKRWLEARSDAFAAGRAVYRNFYDALDLDIQLTKKLENRLPTGR